MRLGTRLLLALAALALAGGLAWRWADGWAPARADYPVQGFEADPDAAPLDWAALKGRADFVYLDATEGASGAARNFLRVSREARAAGLSVGAVHRFSVCAPGREQATNLLAHLPREGGDLPLAVALDGAGCPRWPGTDALVAELAAFLAIAEARSDQPAVLKLTPDLAERYPLADRLDRALWLERRFRQPVASRAWELWLANPARRVPGADRPLPWSVARPDDAPVARSDERGA